MSRCRVVSGMDSHIACHWNFVALRLGMCDLGKISNCDFIYFTDCDLIGFIY